MLESTGLTPTPIDKKRLSFNEQLVWGFTLMELMVVIIIIGILATLAVTYYGPIKESSLDKEAHANLRLIIVAQRSRRMDKAKYYPDAGGTINDISAINTNLKLLLSTAADSSWDYLTTANNTVVPPVCCAQATRRLASPNDRTFRFLNTNEDNPVAGTCP